VTFRQLDRDEKFALVRHFMNSVGGSELERSIRDVLKEFFEHTREGYSYWALHSLNRNRVRSTGVDLKALTEQFLVEPCLKLLGLSFYRKWWLTLLRDGSAGRSSVDYLAYNDRVRLPLFTARVGQVLSAARRVKPVLESVEWDDGMFKWIMLSDGVTWVLLGPKHGGLRVVGEYDLFESFDKLRRKVSGK